ncbi:MAG: hypothetical protein ABWZ88_14835 [Variovorax sp.]
MSSLAEDESTVRCNGCARQLQTWERFCAHCGEDQFARIYAGTVADAPAPVVSQVAEIGPADSRMAIDFAITEPPLEAVDAVPRVAPVAVAPARTAHRYAYVALGAMLGILLALIAHLVVERRYFEDGLANGLRSVQADTALLRAALVRDVSDLTPKASAPERDGAAAQPGARPEAREPSRALPEPTPPTPPMPPSATLPLEAPIAKTAAAPPPAPAQAREDASPKNCSEALRALGLCGPP